MPLGWSSGPHSITLSDQLIRCWTTGMVALTACSLALLLPLSFGSLVNIMYTPSCRGNCCLAFGGGGPGGGGGGGGTKNSSFSFAQLQCPVTLPSRVIGWLADPTVK